MRFIAHALTPHPTKHNTTLTSLTPPFESDPDGDRATRSARHDGPSVCAPDALLEAGRAGIHHLLELRQAQRRHRTQEGRHRAGDQHSTRNCQSSRCTWSAPAKLRAQHETRQPCRLTRIPNKTSHPTRILTPRCSLLQFSFQIDRLSNFHATAHPPPSASATHALERHRDVHSEYKRDYARTKVLQALYDACLGVLLS